MDGALCPKVTGNYVFYLAANDWARFMFFGFKVHLTTRAYRSRDFVSGADEELIRTTTGDNLVLEQPMLNSKDVLEFDSDPGHKSALDYDYEKYVGVAKAPIPDSEVLEYEVNSEDNPILLNGKHCYDVQVQYREVRKKAWLKLRWSGWRTENDPYAFGGKGAKKGDMIVNKEYLTGEYLHAPKRPLKDFPGVLEVIDFPEEVTHFWQKAPYELEKVTLQWIQPTYNGNKPYNHWRIYRDEGLPLTRIPKLNNAYQMQLPMITHVKLFNIDYIAKHRVINKNTLSGVDEGPLDPTRMYRFGITACNDERSIDGQRTEEFIDGGGCQPIRNLSLSILNDMGLKFNSCSDESNHNGIYNTMYLIFCILNVMISM
jgi:hypothetical protein